MKLYFETQSLLLQDIDGVSLSPSVTSASQPVTLSALLRDVLKDDLPHGAESAGDALDQVAGAPAVGTTPNASVLPHAVIGNVAPLLANGDGEGADGNASAIETYVTSVGGAADWVNTTINGAQDMSQIAALGNGGYVVVFYDSSQALGSGTLGEIRAQRFDANGVKVGAEFVVDQVTNTNARSPAVAATANGGFVATWVDTTNGVRARAFDQNGNALTGDFGIQDTVYTKVQGTTIAALADGHYMIGWTEFVPANGTEPSHNLSFAKVFDANNAAVTSAFSIAPPGSTDQYYPNIAAVGDQFVLTWTNIQTGSGNDHSEVLGQRFGATGQPIGNMFQVNTATDNYQYYSTVTGLADGSFVITYSSANSATDSSVYFQRFDHSGIKLGAETLVTGGFIGEETAKVGALKDGNFVIGWSHIATHTAGSLDINPDVYFQEYFADGTPLGATFGAGTPPPAYGKEYNVNADNISFATLASGRLVTTWTDYSSPEPGAGYFGGIGIRQHLVDPLKILFGDEQANTITATDAASAIEGRGGDDTLTGGAGDDQIDGGTGVDLIHGGSGNDTIYGSEGNDQLFGDAGNDTIDGGDGDDVINGGAGSDQLRGGAGNDTLRDVNSGFDNSGGLYGEDGDDDLFATNGAFGLDGGAGNDRLTLYNAASTINAGASSFLSGGDGDDILAVNNSLSSAVALYVSGDGGADLITVTNVYQANINGGDGNDTVRVGGFTNYPSNFTVTLGKGQDLLVITAATPAVVTVNDFNAGEAGDRLDLSTFGADPFGPGGRLTMTNLQGSGVRISDATTNFQLTIAGTTVNQLSAYNLGTANPQYNPQGMTLNGVFADRPDIVWQDYLVGADGNDTIRGYAGDDILFGGGGNDYIDGGTGDDQMTGGSGDDTYILDSSGDRVFENANGGNDTIVSSVTVTSVNSANVETIRLTGTANINATGTADVANILIGNSGNNVLDGGAGTGVGGDRMEGGLGDDTYVIRSSTDVIVEGANAGNDAVYVSIIAGSYTLAADAQVETLATLSPTSTAALNLTGNAYSHDIQGNAGNNVLTGGTGADTILGNGGVDTLLGGAGNDRLIVGAGGNGTIVDGGADTDTLVVTGSVSLGGLSNIEAIELQNGANLTLTGDQFNTGLALGTVLSGTGTITVNMTPDQFLLGSTLAVAPGSSISVVFNGSSGNDYVKGITQATNTMIGGDGNDFLRGGQLADVIDGGTGGDKITGFGGADTLTGGGGANQFRYLTQSDSGLGANADHITDFTIGSDRLNFQMFDGDTNTPDLQNPGFSFLGNQAFHATGAAEIRYEDAGSDLVVQVDVNGDGVADMAIYLNGLHGAVLTGAEFML